MDEQISIREPYYQGLKLAEQHLKEFQRLSVFSELGALIEQLPHGSIIRRREFNWRGDTSQWAVEVNILGPFVPNEPDTFEVREFEGDSLVDAVRNSLNAQFAAVQAYREQRKAWEAANQEANL